LRAPDWSAAGGGTPGELHGGKKKKENSSPPCMGRRIRVGRADADRARCVSSRGAGPARAASTGRRTCQAGGGPRQKKLPYPGIGGSISALAQLVSCKTSCVARGGPGGRQGGAVGSERERRPRLRGWAPGLTRGRRRGRGAPSVSSGGTTPRFFLGGVEAIHEAPRPGWRGRSGWGAVFLAGWSENANSHGGGDSQAFPWRYARSTHPGKAWTNARAPTSCKRGRMAREEKGPRGRGTPGETHFRLA